MSNLGSFNYQKYHLVAEWLQSNFQDTIDYKVLEYDIYINLENDELVAGLNRGYYNQSRSL
jgi:hypothetical protein